MSKSLCRVYALAKTIFSCGFCLLNEKTRSDWKYFFRGKRPEKVLSIEKFVPAKELDELVQLKLGYRYQYGQGVEQSNSQAFNHYLLSARLGNKHAQLTVGWCYQMNIGVDASYEEALKWYRLSLESRGATDAREERVYDVEDAEALFCLACLYDARLGLEIQKRSELTTNLIARQYYTAAAKLGYEAAKDPLKNLCEKIYGQKPTDQQLDALCEENNRKLKYLRSEIVLETESEQSNEQIHLPHPDFIHHYFQDPYTTEFSKLLNPIHPLYILNERMDWKEKEKEFKIFCWEGYKLLPEQMRLVLGFLILEYLSGLSEQQAIQQWLINPYWQYFTGFNSPQHNAPIHVEWLVYFRNLLGQDGKELILQQII